MRMRRPDAPAPPVPAAWVAARGRSRGSPPRAPATPAAAAALVPKAAALSISRWHAGTNDPDADHEKGDIAPRRFGGLRAAAAPRIGVASPRDRSESSSPRSWAESPRTCRKGCGEEP